MGQQKAERDIYRTNHIVKLSAQTSFGIYLVHAMVLDKVRPLFFEGSELFMKLLFAIPLQVLIVLVICTIVVWIIQKIPGLRKIV